MCEGKGEKAVKTFFCLFFKLLKSSKSGQGNRQVNKWLSCLNEVLAQCFRIREKKPLKHSGGQESLSSGTHGSRTTIFSH